MPTMREAQRKQTRPKYWESLGMVNEGSMEEVIIELNFNVESGLKGGKPT